MPTGNLFLKIFVGFWLVTIAVLASWMIAAKYFESLPPDRVPKHQPGPPPRFLLQLMYDLQNEPDSRLPTLVQSVRKEHGIKIYLLDEQGEDLLGANPDAQVLAVAAELDQNRRRAMLKTPGKHYVAHNIYRREQGLLRAVVVFKHPRRGLIRALGENLWLRLTLAAVISGLLCYLLSRLVTNRLHTLQLASRSLAAGDLDSRIDVRPRGGDETDELARSFNSMAAQLQQRSNAQKRLLGDVSHELRSPLARLRIALALAQEQPQHSRSHLARIEQEAERLDELIGQLLSSQSADATLDTHIDLVPLLGDLCTDADFEGQPQHKEVRFNRILEQAIVLSHGDQLLKCFENILRNAVQHTRDQSTVVVTLQQLDDRYEIAVEDQGPGIPDADLARVFDAFYRVDSARSRDTGGYGLGLAIARRVVEQHQGDICARNTGTGLLVRITLPLELREGSF